MDKWKTTEILNAIKYIMKLKYCTSSNIPCDAGGDVGLCVAGESAGVETSSFCDNDCDCDCDSDCDSDCDCDCDWLLSHPCSWLDSGVTTGVLLFDCLAWDTDCAEDFLPGRVFTNSISPSSSILFVPKSCAYMC